MFRKEAVHSTSPESTQTLLPRLNFLRREISHYLYIISEAAESSRFNAFQIFLRRLSGKHLLSTLQLLFYRCNAVSLSLCYFQGNCSNKLHSILLPFQTSIVKIRHMTSTTSNCPHFLRNDSFFDIDCYFVEHISTCVLPQTFHLFKSSVHVGILAS